MGNIYSIENLGLTLTMLLAGVFTAGFTAFIFFRYTWQVECEGYGKTKKDVKTCKTYLKSTKYAQYALIGISLLLFGSALLLITFEYIR